MKNLLLTPLILIFLSTVSNAQTFPNGVYLTIEQLKNKQPAFQSDLNVKLISTDLPDYFLSSDIDSLNFKYVKKKIVAYVKNDSIFLNCNKLKLGDKPIFSLSATKGNFLVFKAPGTSDAVIAASILGGAIGGMIAAAATESNRYLYILSLRTGNVRGLSVEYLQERFKDFPNTLGEYNRANNNNSEPVKIEFVNKLNELILMK